MNNTDFKKLINISSEFSKIEALADVLSNFLETNEVYNEPCAKAGILSKIIYDNLLKTNDTLSDFIQDLHIKKYAPKP